MSGALETRGLVRRFGAFVATDDVSLVVAAGARHALIGPNGAGKTTLVNLLTGVLAPCAGRVLLDGVDVTRLRPHQRVRRGLARTFQISQLLPEMTPLEAVALAVCEQRGLGPRWWRALGAHDAVVERAGTLLQALHLDEVAGRRIGALAYGQQRLVEIALALAVEPKVLLLDEPAAGIPASESRALYATIAALPARVTVLLIEHDMDLVFRYASRISVLVGGALLAEGTPQAIAADAGVRQVYLGEAALG